MLHRFILILHLGLDLDLKYIYQCYCYLAKKALKFGKIIIDSDLTV